MIKKIAIAIAALIVIVLAAAAFQPDSFRVQRVATIKAPPAKIYPLVNNFHNWRTWSPWEKLDPNMKRTFSGPEAGTDAVYGWEGNDAVGAGRMEIKEAVEPSKVVIKLDFLKPFESYNTTEFTFEPKGDETTVTWTMYGPSPFMTKLMSLFSSMDKMVGPDFEKGLGNMKSVAEMAQ